MEALVPSMYCICDLYVKEKLKISFHVCEMKKDSNAYIHNISIIYICYYLWSLTAVLLAMSLTHLDAYNIKIRELKVSCNCRPCYILKQGYVFEKISKYLLTSCLCEFSSQSTADASGLLFRLCSRRR